VFETWGGFDSFELCLVLIALALVLNGMSEKLGYLEWWGFGGFVIKKQQKKKKGWWLGGIYSPNHQFNRWGGCLSMGAPDSPVRHQTGTVHYPVRLLTLL
jgi:hypothetical protein